MGETYQQCVDSGRILRPLFQKIACLPEKSVVLKHLDDYCAQERLNPRDYVDLAAFYTPVDKYIVINPPEVQRRGLDIPWMMGHELGHVIHDQAYTFTGFGPCTKEGFSLFFHMDYVDGLDSNMTAYSDQVKSSLRQSFVDGTLDDMCTQIFTKPWKKVLGYMFFSRLAAITHTHESVWVAMEHPPKDHEELAVPEIYLSRVDVLDILVKKS